MLLAASVDNLIVFLPCCLLLIIPYKIKCIDECQITDMDINSIQYFIFVVN